MSARLLTVLRRRVPKQIEHQMKRERRLALERKKLHALQNFLPFEFVKKEKETHTAVIRILEEQIRASEEKIQCLKRKTGLSGAQRSTRKKFDRPDETEHQKATKKVSKEKALWGDGKQSKQFKKRFLAFAKDVERRGINIRIKEKHHEGTFDVALYHGEQLLGWLGLEYNKRTNCLAIESVQGNAGVTSAAFRAQSPAQWYIVLANRIVSTLKANGEHRVALIDFDHQTWAKNKPEAKGLYQGVERALKKKAKKIIKIEKGKYHLFYF